MIASNAAEINFMEGFALRATILVLGWIACVVYVMRYAEKVKRNPELSIVAHQRESNLDHFLHGKQQQTPEFTTTRKVVLAIFGITFVIMMWGVSIAGWWMAELSALFIGSSIVVGLVARMSEAEITEENEQLPKVKGITPQTIIEDTEIIVPSGREYEVTNAKGKLTLFNETNVEKYLIPSRLKDPTGVIIRTQSSVTIPPKANGKAGQVVVDVIADEYDEDERPIGLRGNLDAGTELYFPALREDLKEVYYARTNKGPLVGGSTLTKYIVTPEDEELAKERMIENFRDRGIQELMREVKGRSKREGSSQILMEKNQLLKNRLIRFLIPYFEFDKHSSAKIRSK